MRISTSRQRERPAASCVCRTPCIARPMDGSRSRSCGSATAMGRAWCWPPAITGDEWEGQLGLGELIRTLEPSQIKGRIVILPSANFPAAMAATRTSPIDGGNMNRAYPGNQDGDITHQIAFWIEHVLLPGNDYALDLHSGGSSLMYTPSALMERDSDEAYFTRCLDLMKAFGAPVSYIAAAPQGAGRTFSAGCRRNGIAIIGTELGGAGALSQATLEVVRSGLLRALSHIGSLQKSVAGAAAAQRRGSPRTWWRRLLRLTLSDPGALRAAGRAGRRGRGPSAGCPHPLLRHAVARAGLAEVRPRRACSVQTPTCALRAGRLPVPAPGSTDAAG